MVSPDLTSTPPPRAFLDAVHVEESGPEGAQPLLLLHGWGSSAELMRPASAGLEDSFRIINVDLPGHGRSAPPPAAWGVPEFAELVDAILEHRDATAIPVIGHSNGGRIALFMASDPRYQGRFSRLVLIGPSGIRPRRSAAYYLKSAWIAGLKAPFRVLPDPARERGLAWLRTTIYWKLAASSDYRATTGVMRETFVKTVRFHLNGQLGSIEAPVLVVWGDNDDSISRHQIDQLITQIEDARLAILPGAGHYAYLDDPAGYQAAVHSFLLEPATSAAS